MALVLPVSGTLPVLAVAVPLAAERNTLMENFCISPEFLITKKAGEKQPQHVRNYKIETNIFMMTTLQGNEWISLPKNIFYL